MGFFSKTPQELCDKGYAAYRAGKTVKGMAQLEVAAEEGCGQAWYYLAKIYEANARDSEDDENEKKAFECYKKAADLDVKAARNELALCYQSGYGTEEDKIKALYYYEKAAILDNNAESMVWMAGIYKTGMAGVRDNQKAFDWYQKAAALGNKDAAFEIGEMYETGQGAAKNEEEASLLQTAI